uniref:Uncharacterized protein n=1 Tax=uncultured organism TaxID=155900 RepID=A0A7L9QCN5_9ZZZZ|nr:hypothetical protein [uncultured organism]
MNGDYLARQAQLQAQLGPTCDVVVEPLPSSHVLVYMIACRSCHWYESGRLTSTVTAWREHVTAELCRLDGAIMAALR